MSPELPGDPEGTEPAEDAGAAAPEPPVTGVAAATIRQLNLIRNIAIADFLLLIPLVIASLSDDDRWVSILGPIHGIGFLVLMFLCVRGVGEGRWGWWFPAIVVVTLGPPGSLYGEWRIRRELEA